MACFLINDPVRRVAPRVRAAASDCMFTEAFGRIFGDAGVETPAAAEEDIDEPHEESISQNPSCYSSNIRL